MKILAGTILFWVLGSSAYAQQAVLEYAYSGPFIENAEHSQFFKEFTRLLATDLEQAAELAYESSNQLLASDEHATSPALAGQILSNAAVADAAQGRYQRASEGFDRALRLIEAEYQVFSPKLMNVLLASGITAMQLGKLKDAEDKFRWAQHIQHRHSGVFSIEQTKSIDWLTRLHLIGNQLGDADLTQKFGLMLANYNYEFGSDLLTDATLKAANYFAERGSKLPFGTAENYLLSRENMFRESVMLFNTAIASIESSYGKDNPRLIEPLRSFARARTTQRTSARSAIPLLERVLVIIAEQTDVDPIDHVRAWVELGDIYIITGGNKASVAYARAWELLETLPGNIEQTSILFAEPKLLYPINLGLIYLEKRPESAAPNVKEFYADVSYVINVKGRVSDIKINDKNVPNSYMRTLKNVLHNSRFRPSLVDGKPQTFSKSERRPFGLLLANEELKTTILTEQNAEATIEMDDQAPTLDSIEPAISENAESTPVE
ncbi:MAG: tetratricopeptide repeat protein [Gammaproteobacteria bacterium]|jgi:tetratricopeptide (TPR) repeat protein|nr:tetratricopeptide repeat protein [Gammaproteobacteria bacterium]MBT5202252.1 tetratricopeptide repeat protein [Gammaproteobacteria bacterium]MBT5602006.1 tetratricopeptide repeat protein [Gammaproteobacteria bacterium]MBT6246496.1 tetratricopeptide repeat protein [Gammaproteobacteria bacterium]